MLFSDSLEDYNGNIPPAIQDAIEEIGHYFNIATLRILTYDEISVVIPITVHVSIPSMGVVDNVDIRPQEPIIIRLFIDLYPGYAPFVLSDRKDFPKEKLSHLYASAKKDPAKLCLVRGDINEWFASKRMENLLQVTEQWFFKAASGRLNEDGNEFDPLRLDSYRGYHVYRYQRLKELVETKTSFLPDQSFACFLSVSYKHIEDTEEHFSFKTELPVQAATIDIILQAVRKAEDNTNTESKIKPEISILVWHPDDKLFTDYEPELPRTYLDLKKYFGKYGIDIDRILLTLKSQKYILNQRTPIIHAINRPKKMIGFNGSYEFVNFLIDINTNSQNKIQDACRVWNQNHIEPFSLELAQTLTDEHRDKSTLFIGAGSLGSKIIMSDARSGKTKIGVCDGDSLLEHNLARHILFADRVGQNKALAIIDEIKKMYKTNPGQSFEAYPQKISTLLSDKIKLYDWLVDTTASQNVQNWLVQTALSSKMNVARCELVNRGNIGLLYIEGENRNPRIDDLVNLAYFRSLSNKALAKWRSSDANKEPDTLNLGLGCSSISTIMADDSISQHAAVFSRLLYSEKDRVNIGGKGLLFINNFTLDGIPHAETQYELVSSFDIYSCMANSGWEIRMLKGLREQMLGLCKKYKPKETGGVLIGICNYKTRTVHIFDIIQAPSDSKGSTTAFMRGVAGLPQKIDRYKEKTGGLIGYVGEWHTHPMQLETLSERDKQTIEELLPVNRKVPIPTLSLIVTNTQILPFIFN